MKRLVTTVGLLTAMILLFNACKDSPSDPGQDPGNTPATLEAVISYSPQSPEMGKEITLDASGSKDGQSIGYEIKWTLENKPSGSSATINSSTQSNATFTPDVNGDYSIKLEISNSDEGLSDDAQETISITDPEKTFVELSGSIDSDKTLKNIFEDPAKKDYLVTGDLDVNAALTIEPGVVVHLEEEMLMSVNQNGTLIAEGTASDSIKFTSSSSEAGLLWQGVFIKSSTALNSLKYVEVSYAGNSAMDYSGTNYKSAIGILEGGKINIENSFIHHNEGYGVYADDDGGILGTFTSNRLENNTTGVAAPANTISSIAEDNLFADNQAAAVEITSSTFDESNTATWNALSDGAAYLVSGNLRINGTLTVAPGAAFEMSEDVLWSVYGALIAEGTSADKISFTTENVTGGLYWKGIYISSADSRNSFKHVKLSYGGDSNMDFAGSNYAALIGVESTGKVLVSNSTFTESKGYGLYVDDEGGQIEGFANNSFADNVRAVGIPADEVDEMDSNTTFSNNSEAEVEIFGTTYNSGKTSAWQPLNGDAFYRVSGNLYVAGELTINPGARFEMDEDVMIRVDGAFIADGEDASNILFTSSNIAGDLHWQGLFIRSANSQNLLNYVDLSYAGNSTMEFSSTNYAASVGVNTDAELSITNSTITDSDAYGIYSKGTTNDFEATAANNSFSSIPSGNAMNIIN